MAIFVLINIKWLFSKGIEEVKYDLGNEELQQGLCEMFNERTLELYHYFHKIKNLVYYNGSYQARTINCWEPEGDIFIEKYEKNEDKTKIFKIVQSNNKIIFKDITKMCETEDKEKELVKKIKISFKKDEDEDEKIIYEISNKEEKWEFKRHIKNIINRINRGKIAYRINFNKLKYIYIIKYSDNQIHFIKTNAISKNVYNYNYCVKVKNSFVFVNNKRRKFNNRKNKFNTKKFNNYNKFNRNNTNKSYANNNKNNKIYKKEVDAIK